MKHVFGPVLSRRLGRSLGVSPIPAKVCSYTCVYCQLGKAIVMDTERKHYFEPEELVAEVKEKIQQVQAMGGKIDYLTFVPDGEPTLDENLGRTIGLLKPLGLKIAVITNTSLIAEPAVRDALAQADWVSLKVDAVRPEVWHRVDRPHRALKIERILESALSFGSSFRAAGGNDFIPRLWAMRKIGHLLTQIRLHGERREWVDAVVRLSVRYGIITPYTSARSEGVDILTDAGRERAAERFLAMPTPPLVGAPAVEMAERQAFCPPFVHLGGGHFVHLSENLLSKPVENRAKNRWPTFQGPTPSLKTGPKH